MSHYLFELIKKISDSAPVACNSMSGEKFGLGSMPTFLPIVNVLTSGESKRQPSGIGINEYL